MEVCEFAPYNNSLIVNILFKYFIILSLIHSIIVGRVTENADKNFV
jgi:hypothetical protein